jgi:hypothetical protein
VRRRAPDTSGVSEDYLALLAESYALLPPLFGGAAADRQPENLNFVARDADFELLVGRLLAMKSRREFFSLG